MSRGGLIAAALIAGLAVALIGLGVWASGALPGGFGGTPWIWAALIGGALAVAGLTGGLMWLAFYSARKGYDDAAHEWRADEAEF